MNRKLLPKNRNAFTLVELLVVIFIIAILFAIATVAYAQGQKVGRNSKRAADLHLMATALEQYYQDHGFYPNTTESPTVKFQPIVTGEGVTYGINCLLGGTVATAMGDPVNGKWTCKGDWTAGGASFKPILGPYKTYLPKLPTDPKTGDFYGYASDGQEFTLTTITYEGVGTAAPAPPVDHAFDDKVRFYDRAHAWNPFITWTTQYRINSKKN